MTAAVGSLVAAACIIHDKDIVVLKDGYKWCANAEGALGWDDPGDTQQLLDNDGVVIQGCSCFTDSEHEQLEDWEMNGAPVEGDDDYASYVLLRDEILHEVREQCVKRAEDLGLTNNNCLEAVPDTDHIFSNGNSGACHYEEIQADTNGDTDTDTDDSPTQPFDLSGLLCSSGSCRAPAALIDDMFARPEAFLLDKTRIEFDTDGTLLFTDVSPGDVAYHAGIRSGDRLLKIDGSPALSLDEVAALLPNLRNAQQATITVKDGYGDEVKLWLKVY